MIEHRDRQQRAGPRLTLRRVDQAMAAVCLGLALAAIGGHWLWQGRLRGRMIDIDRVDPLAIKLQIDVNEAQWPELALMPDIGPELARRIVADRQERGPFRDLDDLRRVRGIGPRTLEAMRPYLLPLADLEATAEVGNGGRPAEGTVN
jgi:competence protein ComEA